MALRGDQGTAHFAVKIARSPLEREHGLMDWRQMGADAGMLFVFDPPVHAVFWMKDTYLPLDMIFLDRQGRVLQIHPDAKPLDESLIDGGDDVAFVLEVNAGIAKARGIAVGSVMRSAEIAPAQAIWKCDAPLGLSLAR